MTVKTSPKKEIKNPSRPKTQTQNFTVIKHFQPRETSLAGHSNINVDFPFVNVENQNSASIEKNSKVLRTVYSAAKKTNSILKEAPDKSESAFERAKSYHFSRLQTEQKRCRHDSNTLKSSSSSSLEMKVEKFTKARSKSFHAGTSKKPYTTQQLFLRSEKGSTSQASSSNFKSTTDPALLQKDLKVKSLKQEILENRRAYSSIRYPQKSSVIGDHPPRITDLTKEISESKANKVLRNKVMITELRSEIAQYKHLKNIFVYNSTEETSASKKALECSTNDSSNQSEVPSSSSQRRPSVGGKRVSICMKPEKISLSFDKDSSLEVYHVRSGNTSRSRSVTGATDTIGSVTDSTAFPIMQSEIRFPAMQLPDSQPSQDCKQQTRTEAKQQQQQILANRIFQKFQRVTTKPGINTV